MIFSLALFQAALQSPDFLYRLQHVSGDEGAAGSERFDGYTIASRISYLVWQAPPDDLLMADAAAGALVEPEVRAAHIERMFADPRAAGPVRDFARQWLGLGRLDVATKDDERFPEFNAELARMMGEQTERFVARTLLDEGGSFEALLTSTQVHSTEELAELYGIPHAGGAEWESGSLSASERAGVLTQAAWLSIGAHRQDGSPVLRGVDVLRRILCIEPGSRPEGIADVPRRPDGDESMQTNRERFESRVALPKCLACHQAFDPIGYTFESFDAIGRYRTHDGPVPVNTEASLHLPGELGGVVGDAIELSHRIASSLRAVHEREAEPVRAGEGARLGRPLSYRARSRKDGSCGKYLSRVALGGSAAARVCQAAPRGGWTVKSIFGRRHLLKLAGLSLGASVLPLAHRLAANPGGVRRLLVVTTRHGTVYDNWKMRHGGPADRDKKESEDWEHDLGPLEPEQLSPILRPLYSLRHKMVVLDGVSMTSSICNSPGDNHGGGEFHALTGANRFIDGEDPAALFWEGMSVDVRIAERVAQAGRYRSLHLTDTADVTIDGIYSRDRGGARIPYEGNPVAIHQRLFGKLETEIPGSLRARVRGRRGSVLDFVEKDYLRATDEAIARDRVKLEQHTEFMSRLADRMEGSHDVVCNTPSAPGNGSLDKLARQTALHQLIAAAFVCDLTRVITFDIGAFTGDQLGAAGKDLHEDFAHKTHPEAVAMMTLYGEENAKLVAQLVETLDSIPEGDGSLLDHTLVVWTGELANGQHDVTPLPYVLFGGRSEEHT
ncbi:MAG: DUF1552 domain-containing protein, partial [Polyangiaceae bacterium]